MVASLQKISLYNHLDRWYQVACTILILLANNGCGIVSSNYKFQMPVIQDVSNKLVWPMPPDIPRYAFIGDIHGESNGTESVRSGSLLSRFFAALVGLGQETEPLIDLLRPQQIVTDDSGRIYVADTGRQSVFVFDELKGEFSLWNESSLNIPFLSPIGLAIVNNYVLVTDSEQAQIFRFNLAGEVIGSIGKGVLKRPTGIAYDKENEHIFVADTKDDNIKVFDLDGQLIDVIGHTGVREGEFNRPTFIAFRNSRLYIADSLNARVQVMDESGENIQSFGQRGLYVGNLSRPKGIATDSDGNIYVVESYYDHVLIYNAQGELLMSLGGSGNQPGQFSQPTGIWIDAKDRVFISDMLNGRVSVYQYLGGH